MSRNIPNVDFIKTITGLLNLNNVSSTERAVLFGVLQGLTNREIGEELHVQEGTVKSHISKLFRKLNVRDRSNLIIKMAKLGHYGQRAEVVMAVEGLPKGLAN